MKIAFFEVRPDEQKLLESALTNHTVTYYSEKFTSTLLPQLQDIEVLGVFVGSEVRKETIDALPNLKLIVTRSTGFDHIDSVYAKEKGIAVATVPAYGTHTVAEFTFALILALSRKTYAAIASVHEKKHFELGNLKGFDLFGKTIGIIGTGKIGKNVAIIAKGFGMRVIATDAYPDAQFAQEQGVTYVSLEELLRQSDIISVHTPYMKETHHLINTENIQHVKKGAVLINTARGEIVETKALVTALQSGQLSAAGLDVLEGERKLSEDANSSESVEYAKQLITMEQVIITPHIAFFTAEAEQHIIDTTIENINTFIQGKAQNTI